MKSWWGKLRAPVWWHHLVPPILSVAYVIIWIQAVPIGKIALPIFLFIASIIGTAGFGYWLNDWSDIKDDRRAGKRNMAADLSNQSRALVLCALLIIAWLPWMFIPATKWSYIFLGLLQLSFVLYSIPPFRFKQRSFLGILCDIHYGHVLPIAIALATFLPLWMKQKWSWGFIIGIIGLLYLKGIRNILEHQIKDRKNDLRSHTFTFVQAIGAVWAAWVLRNILIPIELGAIAVLLARWSLPLFLLYILYLGIYAFLFWRWGIFRLPMRRWNFHFWYIANDFYEGWLPLSILLLASSSYPVYWIILIIHLSLFPKCLQIIKWLFREVQLLIAFK